MIMLSDRVQMEFWDSPPTSASTVFPVCIGKPSLWHVFAPVKKISGARASGLLHSMNLHASELLHSIDFHASGLLHSIDLHASGLLHTMDFHASGLQQSIDL